MMKGEPDMVTSENRPNPEIDHSDDELRSVRKRPYSPPTIAVENSSHAKGPKFPIPIPDPDPAATSDPATPPS